MDSLESSLTFDRYWLILKRRWLPASVVFITVFLIVSLAVFLKKPAYVAEGKLRFQRTNTTSSLTGLGREIGNLESLTDTSNPVNTEAEVIRSVPVVQKTINLLNLKDNKGVPLKSKDFLKRLSVDNIRASDILKVSYKDKNPERAAQIVTTLMSVYLDHHMVANRTQTAAARQFIEKQLPEAEVTVRQAEVALRQFKESNKVVALQEEATKAVEVIADLQKQINQAESKIAELSAQSQAIGNQLAMNSQEAVTKTSISQSPGVVELLKEVQQVESQLAAKRTVFQDAHPEVINLNNKLVALKGLLQQRVGQVVATQIPEINTNLQIGELKQQLTAKLVELESNRLGFISQAAALSNLQTSYKQRLNILPKLEQQQRELQRQLEASQSTYSLLLQRFQESRIAENQNVGNVRIVSNPEIPEEPISSNMALYLSGGMIGLLASIATIYLLEARDKSIKTVDEAKDLFGLTLLGVIPNSHSEDAELLTPRLVVKDTPRSPISEAYRMLRANLKFLSADKELKVIVVTSSVPKEGKSTVSANLAIAMAQMERKVLLVDADLHRPVQHQIWELHNNLGLSNVIISQAEFRDAAKQVMDNLDVLTSGVVPPSPAALLDSKRMAKLIDSFATNYDFVIIDTPSLNVGADAATLGQMADGVLLVVRPEVVDTVKASFAKELLEKSGQNVLGQVVNGVIPKNEPYSYYYFAEEYNSKPADLQQEVARTAPRNYN